MALKVLLILILAAGLAPPVSAEGPAAPPPADDAAIRSHFAAFDTAFARGDAPGVAATYADDADVVRPGEPAVVGRAGIESFYREMFAGRMKGVRKGGAVERIRLVTPSVALLATALTTPKSVRTTRPCDRSTFSGFRSRCTI